MDSIAFALPELKMSKALSRQGNNQSENARSELMQEVLDKKVTGKAHPYRMSMTHEESFCRILSN
jgi:hypothetical protein